MLRVSGCRRGCSSCTKAVCCGNIRRLAVITSTVGCLVCVCFAVDVSRMLLSVYCSARLNMPGGSGPRVTTCHIDRTSLQ